MHSSLLNLRLFVRILRSGFNLLSLFCVEFFGLLCLITFLCLLLFLFPCLLFLSLELVFLLCLSGILMQRLKQWLFIALFWFSLSKNSMADRAGVPGDGRCLFRSVAHGACLRLGKPSPSENLQKELADELRAKVADELVKRRKDTEWFLEGDFDTYVQQIRKPHVWGGEPELLMASHVLHFLLQLVWFHRMPITVFMRDHKSGSLLTIAEYGQDYGREDPIRVLYHGFGHYDALDFHPSGAKSKLFQK
ncbi:hypothetical protein AMTRI_Chr06g174640 [Amborella trichopoda]